MAKFYVNNGYDRDDPRYAFVGYDEIAGLAVEATYPQALGTRMSADSASVFGWLTPGETAYAMGHTYYRI